MSLARTCANDVTYKQTLSWTGNAGFSQAELALVPLSLSMKKPSDAWYVRFPDGRVLRASSTQALRHHIGAGRIPPDCLVRRTPEEEWVTLEWSQEFGDLVSTKGRRTNHASPPPQAKTEAIEATDYRPIPTPVPGNIASRLDGSQLQTVGVRGLVDELLAAMDSTLVRTKLVVACVAGVVCGALVAFGDVFQQNPILPWPWLHWAVLGVLFLIIGAVSDHLLTQMTYFELANLRPGSWRDARRRLLGSSLKLMAAYLLTAGAAVLAIVLARHLPGWADLVKNPPWVSAILHEAAPVFSLVLEMILWPVLVFALLLGPIMIVEECSIPAALAQWGKLMQDHLGRVFLYEGLAAAMGIIFTLPFVLPLILAARWQLGPHFTLNSAVGLLLCIMSGFVVSPLIAYLAVANVFIYLNLRYEIGPQR